MNKDPQAFYTALYDLLKEENMLPGEDNTDQEQEQEGQEQQLDISEIAAMRAELAELRNGFQKSNQDRENAQMEVDLDKFLDQMQNDLGAFDRDYVVAKLAKGVTPKDAFNQYQAQFEGYTKSTPNNRPGPPKVHTGASGAVPQEQAKPSFKNNEERKKFLVGILQAANAED